MRAFSCLFILLLNYPILVPANQKPLVINNEEATSIRHVTQEAWRALNSSVHGRLHAGSPLSRPCFARFEGHSQKVDQASCQLARDEYRNEGTSPYHWVAGPHGIPDFTKPLGLLFHQLILTHNGKHVNLKREVVSWIIIISTAPCPPHPIESATWVASRVITYARFM